MSSNAFLKVQCLKKSHVYIPYTLILGNPFGKEPEKVWKMYQSSINSSIHFIFFVR